MQTKTPQNIDYDTLDNFLKNFVQYQGQLD